MHQRMKEKKDKFTSSIFPGLGVMIATNWTGSDILARPIGKFFETESEALNRGLEIFWLTVWCTEDRYRV